MYAFVLRKRRNLSKQSRQQRTLQTKHLVQAFSPDAYSILLPTYSKRPLISHMQVKIDDPRARLPQWYLQDQTMPFHTSESPAIPSLSLISLRLKYQVAAEQITTNSFIATIKAPIQIMPITSPKIIQLVPDVLSTVLNQVV